MGTLRTKISFQGGSQWSVILQIMIYSSWRILNILSKGENKWGTNHGGIKQTLPRGFSKWSLLWKNCYYICNVYLLRVSTWALVLWGTLAPIAKLIPTFQIPNSKVHIGVTHTTPRENLYHFTTYGILGTF